MSEASEQQRREVIYSGLVQGVGFRYTARQIAYRHPVTGYVQNLADGRVQLVVEGAPAELERFIGAIAAHLRENIRGVDICELPATGEFASFEIRH